MIHGPDLPAGARRVPYKDPGLPDHRSPLRFLWWLTKSQRRRVLLGATWGSTWMCALMLPPYLMSKTIDDGLRARDTGALLLWIGAVVVTGAGIAIVGILRHRTMTRIRVDAAYRTVQVVTRHVTRLGSTLPRQVSAGELAHLQAGDISRIAQTLTVTGPGVGAVLAYVATAVLLFRISAVLALVILLGVPALALTVGPLLGKLHGAESRYREDQGTLTSLAGDMVAGLSVLNGIGGKRMFAGRYRERSQALVPLGYRVAAITSWVQALTACLPMVFLAVVTWISARMAASGAITVGELVAVYGYVAALLVPVSFFIEGADDLPRGLVSARRVVDILALAPAPEEHRTRLDPPDAPSTLHDPTSGLVIDPGKVTALVGARSDEPRAVVDRLAGYTDSDVSWGGTMLSDWDRTALRRHILLADNDAYMFAGPLRTVASGRTEHSDDEVRRVLRAAAAEDIVEALPDGLDSRLENQARNVSGGQRQRLRLSRALLADPAVLLLVEPTSALDAHTEATVAARVARHRRGRTTLVVSTSPLVLGQADEVAYLVDGKVRATGTHGELLASQPEYAALVFRGSTEIHGEAAVAQHVEGESR
ncbi:ABC transporter ATP-binding protein/permease [Streptomyces sp. NBC_00841]|uniref:ABC transporter ATP-binding protein n=1 Tax=unclassified Streptomyces TaxID=2593676 RepID=UPI002258FE24|nr:MULTISPECIES: ABC transporter ATP-binding protein [unclassified Streptomyces]MCX4532540.1 ABC transporter ATP-binding protein/permease [Streptomyces sp. NBC_01669]WSA01977.1 ABC transporter ATP-binding protein/permease [Streptomyces sp. NBC_00841]